MIETCTPSLAGSSGQDSPSLTGWGIAVTSGQQESRVNSCWEYLTTEKLFGVPEIKSPIERAFFRCFRYVMLDADMPDKLVIRPQEKIGQFRVDFLITTEDGQSLLVVECDGHEFHERTKEQAAKDRSRDRDLLASGIPVMRFTGAEIFAAPFGCAIEAVCFAYSQVKAS